MRTAPSTINRRAFLHRATTTAGALLAAPALVPASAVGRNAPSNRLQIGCIGVGRMGLADLKSYFGFPDARVVAVCDVDSRRRDHARDLVDQQYGDKRCAALEDFRELIARPDVDIVSITVPDHWHAIPAIAAARAGKDVFLQKPLTYTIAEGRALSDAIRHRNLILQVGSQQRSEPNFLLACELVRNGRIGQLKKVLVGVAPDPGNTPQPVMPVPPHLNYDLWLGPAPWAPYTEARVHPADVNARPGWLRILDYSLGMVTGWGAHHIDIAHWGMGTELSGPSEIRGACEWLTGGLHDVPGRFRIEYSYPHGVTAIFTAGEKLSGIRFEGRDGWVHVDRGKLMLSDPRLRQARATPGEIHLHQSTNHKLDFLQAVRRRTQPAAPVEIAHRSNTACILGFIAMRLGRTIRWDPLTESFPGDPEANRLLDRPPRAPWITT